MPNQPAAWRAQGHANGRLKACGGAARQQQVRNVGARNRASARPATIASRCRPSALSCWRLAAPLLADATTMCCFSISGSDPGREVRLGAQPVLELCGDLRLNARRIGPRLQAPDDVEPVHSRAVQQCGLPIVGRLGGQRQPEIGRIRTQLISEESRRGYSNHGEGEIVDVQGGADDRGIEQSCRHVR